MDRRGKVRCAVIGTGRIGSSLETDRLREKPASHAGAISADGRARLIAGADVDPDALASFAAQWKLPREALFTDADTLLERARPDLVSIACDTDEHDRVLRLCLRHTVPVIVLEKPIASSLEEARATSALVEGAARAGTSRVVVNHERRFARDWKAARDIIRSRRYGPLRSLHARLYMGKTKAPESVLWHDGTHLVDIVRFLVGPWKVLACHGDSRDKGANFLAVGIPGELEGVHIVLETAPGRDYLAFEVDLNFESGRVRVGNGLWETWDSKPSRLYETYRSLELTSPAGKNPYKKTKYFSSMMAHAIDLALNPSIHVESSYDDGLAALELLDAIIKMGKK